MKINYAKRSITVVSAFLLALISWMLLSDQLQVSLTLVAIVCLGAISTVLLYIGIRALATAPPPETGGNQIDSEKTATSQSAEPAPLVQRIDPKLLSQLQEETDRLQILIDELIEKQKKRHAARPKVEIAPVPHVKTKVKIDDPLNN